MNRTYTNLSKTISYALRHNPGAFGLTLDSAGWVEVMDLLNAVNKDSTRAATVSDLWYIIDHSEKKRFEIDGSRIRATYGHSVAEKIDLGEPTVPPDTLFHGTAAETFYLHIETEGLKPMNRQMVHLSTDVATARKVALRHSGRIVLIAIDAKRMWQDGIKFYRTANDGTWLCGSVDCKYFVEYEYQNEDKQ